MTVKATNDITELRKAAAASLMKVELERPSKHRSGRTKPLTKEQRKKRDRLLAKLEQSAKSAEIDKRTLGG